MNGKIYKTNSFVANILSPNISKLYEESLDVSYYEINTEYDGDFNRILEYGEMKERNIKEGENEYFFNIMKELGNHHDFSQFYTEFEEDISIENALQRIEIKRGLNLNHDEEILFISRNFHDFLNKSKQSIMGLGIDIIEQILSNYEFKIQNEEELFDIVLKLYHKSKEYSILFSYVIFVNLSAKSIQEFTANFDINDINNNMWENICFRLEQDISCESREQYQKLHHRLLGNRYYGKRYERIIKHLSEQFHGNVHTENIVHITSSTKPSSNIENIVEQSNNEFFVTKDEANSYIRFHFKEGKILFDSYTLKTYHGSKNYAHLKSWILEVSNDGKNYQEVDRHENCDLLNGPLRKSTFKVSISTPQRFVRLTQIGPNWLNNNCLILNQIEFSGFLYE